MESEKNIQKILRTTIEEINMNYSLHREKFDFLCSELVCCARQIKIWLAISQAKETNGDLKFEPYFAWIQIYSLKSIVVDAYKISQETVKYIRSILSYILSKDQCKNLIKQSKLQSRINNLKTIIEPLKDWRNKRYVHPDIAAIKVVRCNLHDLFSALANLDNSLLYIIHFLLNPRYIIEEAWRMYKIVDINNDQYTCSLDRYFSNDPTFQEFLKMISVLNEEKSQIFV